MVDRTEFDVYKYPNIDVTEILIEIVIEIVVIHFYFSTIECAVQ
jgi:hypothetical protein